MNPYRVLVVEDDAMVRKLLRVTLETGGFRPILADTAARALALAAAEAPDLVLQDLTLPDMDGHDLALRLRQLPQLAGVPMIAFSGLAPSHEEAWRRRAPFTAYLLKPVAPSSLLDALRAHLPARAEREPQPPRAR